MTERRSDNTLGLCYLCGIRQATTADHVPPKVLFPPPRPSDLLTLPACLKCNSGFSTDEEELALSLSSAPTPTPIQSAAIVFARLKRGFKNVPGRLLKRLRGQTAIETPSRIIVGRAGIFGLDRNKINRALIKIAHGLHYHHSGQRPPSVPQPFVRLATQKIEQEYIFDKGQTAHHYGSWLPHFSYRGFIDPDSDGAIWVLRFYRFHIGVVVFGTDMSRIPFRANP
jgi:hypothetical protein